MRIHPTSIRLGYSVSWDNKTLPGRSYQDQLSSTKSRVERLVASFFQNSLFRNSFLFSHAVYHYYTNNLCLATFYIYSYRYAECLNLLARKKSRQKVFNRFLVQHYLHLLLKPLSFLFSTLFQKFRFHFVMVVNRFFRAELVSQYIINQLANRFKISKIVPALGKNLIQNKKNRGLLVQCSGRFDRKERASYHIYGYGKVSINTLNNPVYYHRNEITLKYGVCGVKVWLLKNK